MSCAIVYFLAIPFPCQYFCAYVAMENYLLLVVRCFIIVNILKINFKNYKSTKVGKPTGIFLTT